MDLALRRFSYASSETEGILTADDHDLATIERPWMSWHTLGGKPFASCIPDGEYDLDPWVRPDGSDVYILSNPELGVFKEKEDRIGNVGRYLVLIHIGNWVTDIVGCIAPGVRRSIMKNPETGNYENSVSSSGEAMKILRAKLGREETHRLTISSKCGTGG